jgi:hypothetical protein
MQRSTEDAAKVLHTPGVAVAAWGYQGLAEQPSLEHNTLKDIDHLAMFIGPICYYLAPRGL